MHNNHGPVSKCMKRRILKSRKALREKYPMIGGIRHLDHIKLANKWAGENCPQCNTPMSDPWTQMGDHAGFCDDCCCGGCGSRKAYPGQCHCLSINLSLLASNYATMAGNEIKSKNTFLFGNPIKLC